MFVLEVKSVPVLVAAVVLSYCLSVEESKGSDCEGSLAFRRRPTLLICTFAFVRT